MKKKRHNKLIATDEPILVSYSEAKKSMLKGEYRFHDDTFKALLIKAEAEATAKNLPFTKIIFYIECFTSDIGYYLKKKKKKKKRES